MSGGSMMYGGSSTFPNSVGTSVGGVNSGLQERQPVLARVMDSSSADTVPGVSRERTMSELLGHRRVAAERAEDGFAESSCLTGCAYPLLSEMLPQFDEPIRQKIEVDRHAANRYPSTTEIITLHAR
jgi:hypothetical protein